jgi:hypothetical protein
MRTPTNKHACNQSTPDATEDDCEQTNPKNLRNFSADDATIGQECGAMEDSEYAMNNERERDWVERR